MEVAPSELMTLENQAEWYAKHQKPLSVFYSIFVAIWECFQFQRTPSQHEILRILIFSLASAFNERSHPIQDILAVCGAIGFPPSTGGNGGKYISLAEHYLKQVFGDVDPENAESIQTTKDSLKECASVMMERKESYSFYTIQLAEISDEIGSWGKIGKQRECRWELLRDILKEKDLLYQGEDDFEVVLVDLKLKETGNVRNGWRETGTTGCVGMNRLI
jgi:hypothetical protein